MKLSWASTVGTAATAALSVAALGVGVLMTASVAGSLAHAWLEAEKAKGEAAQLEYAQRLKALHKQQMHKQNQMSQALDAAITALQLTAPQQQSGYATVGTGFLSASPQAQQQKQLTAIADALAIIPPSWQQAHANAWQDIQQQWHKQRAQPNYATLTALHKNLHNILRQAKEESALNARLINEAQALHHEIVLLQVAAPTPFKPRHQELLAYIENSLQHSQEQLSQLPHWREQLAILQQQCSKWQEQMAIRHALSERLAVHLRSKGYQALGQGRFRLPGGEQVQIHFDAQGAISMRLIHERAQATNAALSADEFAFFQQQEHAWHQDLAAIVPDLVADGFPLTVQHHETIPAEAVVSTFVDRADQWQQDTQRISQPSAHRLPRS